MAAGAVIGRGLLATSRGWVLFLRVIPGAVIITLWSVSVGLIGVGVGVLLFPLLTIVVHQLANLARGLSANWCDRPIERPYERTPRFGPHPVGWAKRTVWLLGQRSTWRDALWMLLDPIVGATLALLPLALLLGGIFGLLFPWLFIYIGHGATYFPFLWGVDSESTALLAAPIGAIYLVAGIRWAPNLLRLHGQWTAWLLKPSEKARLTQRVEQLSTSRADAVDTQALEIRRIERDLHDGAQARLVAMGMSLGAAEALLDTDPTAARTLLVEARASSAQALAELRALVRGIHPPVLSDRGLADAVRSLALESPLEVTVDAVVPRSVDPALESAVYFGISELLTNAAKHAKAVHGRVVMTLGAGVLRAVVIDDGVGGADPLRGTGLTGLKRRLAVFDGTLSVSSPSGGPTIATLEVPCESS